MKTKTIKKLMKDRKAIVAGEIVPGRIYSIEPDGQGGFIRKESDPEEFRRRAAEAAAEPNETRAARTKLQLSQSQFARLLGVSVDTLQNWEQGRREPRGAAKVLLRLASSDPAAVLAAATC